MLNIKPTRTIICIIISIFISSCSSSSTGVPPINTSNSPQPVSADTSRALLPVAEDPNSIGLQLIKGSDGALHATYADKQGAVFYAKCNASCGQSTAWSNAVVDKVDIGFSGFAVPRLELNASNQPRIAFHVAGGTFDRGNLHYAQCDQDCLNPANWNANAVIGYGGSLLEFQLAETDWFALDAAGNPVVAILIENGLLDTDRRLRLLSCERDCTQNASWSNRTVATYNIVLSKPVEIDINANGQFNLGLYVEGIGSDLASLVWYGCSSDCLNNGSWSAGANLETVEADFNSLPDMGLAVSSNGSPTIISYNDADSSTLTLHSCSSNCGSNRNWTQYDFKSKIAVQGGLYDPGYGVDAQYIGDALEVVFAAKAIDSPLRQLVLTSRCESNCISTNSAWQSSVIAKTDEQLDGQGNCSFIGTRVASDFHLVPGAVGFTASPQWACGLEPVLVTGPDGEQSYDYAGDIRFLELSTVVTF